MNNNQKTVKLKFNSKIIDQLGTDMYQHPVAAIAELISNAWDADAFWDVLKEQLEIS